MSFPLLPLLDDAASPLIPALATIGPILIPPSLFSSVNLPSNARYYISATGDDNLVALLDAGAEKVVVTPELLREGDTLPRERVIIQLTEEDASNPAKVKSAAEAASGILIISSSASLDHSAKSLGVSCDIFLQSASPSPSTSSSSTVVVPTSQLTPESIATIFISRLTSDRPDGLFPTIVTSATGTPLGLVYSSAESVAEAIKSQTGVYQSRKHGLWRKGETSGSVQELLSIRLDCDSDALLFTVVQHGSGFCHIPNQATCFGDLAGLAKLEHTLTARLAAAPEGSYTKRLFTDEKLLRSKIMEEAEELCDASTKEEIAFEAADLIYFALTRCVTKGVGLADIEKALDKKALKVTRRKGDAKGKWADAQAKSQSNGNGNSNGTATAASSSASAPAAAAAAAAGAKNDTVPKEGSKPSEPVPASFPESDDIRMRSVELSTVAPAERAKLLLRPVLNSLAMIDKVKPIVERVRTEGDEGLRAMTKQFDKADLSSNILLPPYATPSEDELPLAIKSAIDQAYANVKAFHAAQQDKPLQVETMPGVVCSRFARPIARVGVYVPGGTAILPSTAIMLGVPAQVAGCKTIVLATPPRPDGSISPEVLYVAQLTGVTCILKAGGAQAVAAMAYGTKEVPKVDKIFGPGNQWVTAAKMLVQNDTDALVAIDMPAGPSEVLVIADHTANSVFVASDLLSQAEHGTDSQVVLIAISLSATQLAEIEEQIDIQAKALPRVAIAREAIKKSLIVKVDTLAQAVEFSNEYAPEHLILHLEDAPGCVAGIENAGSIFVGAFSPESCGDYASGTNHTLPTNGFARQFSGVNTLSFQKHITSQELTADGLRKLGPVVVALAEREGLEAHANAVRVRLATL